MKCECNQPTKIRIVSDYPLQKSKTGDVGYDIKALNDGQILAINPGQTIKVHTSVHLELPDDHEAQVRPRSGLSSKGILVHFGTVDSGYRGEILVSVTNLNEDIYLIDHGDRIAQIVFAKKDAIFLEETDHIEEATERGTDGSGSTGR